MTTGSILLALALLILVVLFLARPFLVPVATEPPFTRRQRLEAEKEALLEQIRALEFDYDTGKLPEEAFRAQRAQLVEAAAVILQQIDQVTSHKMQGAEEDMETRIETAVAHLRTRPAPASNGKGGFCPQCGQPVDPGDKFCASCGHQLSKQLPVASPQ